MKEYYARTIFSKELNPVFISYQPLDDHLKNVASLAKKFGEKIHVPDWCYLAGIWHDLGKYHNDFQAMLKSVAEGGSKGHVDHSSAGAVHTLKCLSPVLRRQKTTERLIYILNILTASIAGHHAGLPAGQLELDNRLKDKESLYYEVLNLKLPGRIVAPIQKVPPLPERLRAADDQERKRRTEFLVRMIFSVLVDADRLDAETSGDSILAEDRRVSLLRSGYVSISQLRQTVDDYIDKKVKRLASKSMEKIEKRVFAYRQAVLKACREAAETSPGSFSLSVATGGGKTLSSLSFALRHAEKHNMDRVIVVIPFISITEQTAAEYKKALGVLSENLIEHHSGLSDSLDRSSEPDFSDFKSERCRLATENWDAPLIVTTAVQFFESLFSWTPSRCRKLHNIANSVVIIDEAQMLPPFLLSPTVWVINELVEAYGTSIVLSTATPPSLEKPFPEVRNLRSVVSKNLSSPPRRVYVADIDGQPTTWPRLAVDLVTHRQVLCITHRRADARDLSIELDHASGEKLTIHLSANMCPEHRSIVVQSIREKLNAGLPCRVVSTQLVEAGIDLDFPVVYRALAGVDSLAQAAGRANREGKLGESGGLLKIFIAPTTPPPGLLRLAFEAADTLITSAALDGRRLDIFADEVCHLYFHRYYEKISDMDGGIDSLRREFMFRDVGTRYCFIKDSGPGIVIPFNVEAEEILRVMRSFGPTRKSIRAIQRYSVNVYPNEWYALSKADALECLAQRTDDPSAGIYALKNDYKQLYDERFGLNLNKIASPDIESLIH